MLDLGGRGGVHSEYSFCNVTPRFKEHAGCNFAVAGLLVSTQRFRR